MDLQRIRMANINSDLIALSSHIIKINKYLSVKSNMLSSNSRFHFDTLSNRYTLLQSNRKRFYARIILLTKLNFQGSPIAKVFGLHFLTVRLINIRIFTVDQQCKCHKFMNVRNDLESLRAHG